MFWFPPSSCCWSLLGYKIIRFKIILLDRLLYAPLNFFLIFFWIASLPILSNAQPLQFDRTPNLSNFKFYIFDFVYKLKIQQINLNSELQDVFWPTLHPGTHSQVHLLFNFRVYSWTLKIWTVCIIDRTFAYHSKLTKCN